MKPLVWIDAVGLTPRHVGPETPHLARLAASHGARPMTGVLPAVTMTAQASMLTGLPPARHGIVGNGWLHRDLREIRFWPQARALIQGETLYEAAATAAAARGERFTCAKLFWWFNQGAAVDWSLTPKPHYGAAGEKALAIHGKPAEYVAEMERALGRFPFPAFWGPMAGLASSDWIARAAERTLERQGPTLTLVYLPHLDYDLQRLGATGPHLPARLRELDAAVGRIHAAAEARGAAVLVVSEYGIVDAARPVHLNRALRRAGLLTVRDGPFGERLELFQSDAVAVADHQLAHIYLRDGADGGLRAAVADCLRAEAGVEAVWDRPALAARGLDHPRAGDLVAVAERDAWFTYYYWLDEARAPDFAPTVEIHRKPGYDPAELFFDPALIWPTLEAAWCLGKRRLGFRAPMELVPTDGALVRGSHGLPPVDPLDGPVWISTGPPPEAEVAEIVTGDSAEGSAPDFAEGEGVAEGLCEDAAPLSMLGLKAYALRTMELDGALPA